MEHFNNACINMYLKRLCFNSVEYDVLPESRANPLKPISVHYG